MVATAMYMYVDKERGCVDVQIDSGEEKADCGRRKNKEMVEREADGKSRLA